MTVEQPESGVAVRSSDLLSSPFYRDSHITIINAYCRDVMHKLPRGLVVTDPPYNVGYHHEGYKDNLTTEVMRRILKITDCQRHSAGVPARATKA